MPPVLQLPPRLHSHQVHAAAGELPAAAAAAGICPPGAQSDPCMTGTAPVNQGRQVLGPLLLQQVVPAAACMHA